MPPKVIPKRWFSDTKEGFVLAEAHPADPNKWLVKQKGSPVEVTGESWESNPPDQDGVKDNTMLMHLHEPGVLHNIKIRFLRDEVYTYTGYILIAMNPYKPLSIYGDEQIQKYRGKAIGLLDPHVYAVADRAYRSMFTELQSQSILVSGESGAGKTETSKIVMKFLVKVGGRSDRGGEIEDRILESNPIMEAFGNAKTIRNNNSSRFGKYMQMHFNKSFQVCGASIVTYLLEKSRIVRQSKNERNYHIFYQLCAGATEEEKQKYFLQPATQFNYLSGGNACIIDGMDDKKEFLEVKKAFRSINLSDEVQHQIWSIIAGILYLGNIQFREGRGENSFVESREELKRAATLLGLGEDTLEFVLTHRKIVAKAQTFDRPLTAAEARDLCNVLAKTIYSNLFDWVVSVVNKSLLSTEEPVSHIGILDIFGFESFDVNSFEQLCINYTNETLQQYFNSCIFIQELDLYKREGIKAPEIEYQDNQDCITLIDEKKSPAGILSILDEEMKLPNSRDTSFTEKIYKAHGNHSKLGKPPRKMTTSEAFVVKHYAGDVCYSTAGFLEKNTNTIHPDHQSLLSSTTNDTLKALFPPSESAQPSGNRFNSVASDFVKSLTQLMQDLRETESHFIRCIKPTTKQKPGVFEGDIILNQLRCNGMMAALQLMHAGYPTRSPYDDLHKRFKSMLPEVLLKLKTKDFCEALLMTLEIDRKDFALGISKVFFRSGKLAFLDELKSAGVAQSANVVTKIVKWVRRKSFRLAIWTAISTIKLARKAALLRHLKAMKLITKIMLRIGRYLYPRLARVRRKMKSVRVLQRIWRGFKVRKIYGPILAKKRVERRLQSEEQKRRNMEILLKNLEEEKKKKEAEEKRIREEEEEKKRKEIAQSVSTIKAQMEEDHRRTLKAKEEEMIKEKAEAASQKSSLEKKLAELEKKNHELSQQLHQAQNDNATLQKTQQQLKKEIESQQSRARSAELAFKDKLASAEKEAQLTREQLEARIQELQNQYETDKDKASELEDSWGAKYRELQNQHRLLKLQSDDDQTEISRLKNELSKTSQDAQRDKKEKSEHISRLENEAVELKAKITLLEESLAREKNESASAARESQKKLAEKETEIAQLSAQVTTANKKFQKAQQEREEEEEKFKEDLSKLKKELSDAKSQAAKKDESHRLEQERLKEDHHSEIQELKDKIHDLERQVKSRSGPSERPQSGTAANPEAVAQLASLQKELKQSKDAANKANIRHKAEVDRLQETITDLEAECERYKREAETSGKASTTENRKKIRELERQVESANEELTEAKEEAAKVKSDLERKLRQEKEKLKEAIEDKEDLQRLMEKEKSQRGNVQEKVQEYLSEIDALKGKIAKLERDAGEFKSSADALKEEDKKREVSKERMLAALRAMTNTVALPPHLRDMRGALAEFHPQEQLNSSF